MVAEGGGCSGRWLLREVIAQGGGCLGRFHYISNMNFFFTILGGYEEFSALYPFLRTQKIMYLPRVGTRT